MAAKKKSGTLTYKCSSCGYTQPAWLGRCPECGEWNSFEEIVSSPSAPLFGESKKGVAAKPVPLNTVNPMDGERLSTGIGELDRVLGGGAMRRSAILIGGEPGIGKSTLLLQTAAAIQTKGRILYVSGEESAAQIRSRADRLCLNYSNIEILCTSRLEDIDSALNSVSPVFVIVDSIQTVYTPDAGQVPGTINQLKYAAHELISWVKERDSVLFLVAHVTKEGLIAGPKALEHIVDTVISFERNDDEVRFLRARKNRFGSVDELGIFSMGEKGLLPVEDPSSMFIIRRSGALPPGVAVVPVFEGSRVFMVEIQALTVPAKAAVTRVYSDQINTARVSRVAAVLEKRLGLRFSDQDLYINVAGGVRITESAADLALAAALYSARTDMALPEATVLVGELSLAGEVRPVGRIRQRAKTAKSLGFSHVYAPEDGEGIHCVRNIKETIGKLFGKG
ncbi:MAG: DNA repair protein RadA [Spirochaetaceae bacterium]|jgi:DNA repair protein RadA/Sms|nr:DNA repair protein RadA [Spirochaetaceae bacterium]